MRSREWPSGRSGSAPVIPTTGATPAQLLAAGFTPDELSTTSIEVLGTHPFGAAAEIVRYGFAADDDTAYAVLKPVIDVDVVTSLRAWHHPRSESLVVYTAAGTTLEQDGTVQLVTVDIQSAMSDRSDGADHAHEMVFLAGTQVPLAALKDRTQVITPCLKAASSDRWGQVVALTIAGKPVAALMGSV